MKLKSLARCTVFISFGALTPHSTLCADDTNAPAADSRRLWQIGYDQTAFGKWLGDQRITISGHVDQGVTGNVDGPRDHLTFGRLFDDRANDYLLNQVLLTIERPLAPQEGQFDWGFRFQFLYGSDARFIHTLGVLDNVSNRRFQPDIVEAYGNLHFPVLTPGGMDLKLGQFNTLMGAEVIDAEGNFFYSHTYSFNFGVPFKHMGLMLTTHVTDQLDLCLGAVRGINTGLVDNNDRPAFHGGIGWHTKDGKVALFSSAHVGPEDPEHGSSAVPGLDANSDLRVISSTQITIKPTDKLAFITDLTYGDDDGYHAEWYGVAQYVTYQLSSWLSVGARGEVFRDDDGFAVVKFADNDDAINAQRGEPLNPNSVGGGDTTYTAFTLGLNVKPHDSLVLRPEIRWDWASDSHRVFDASTKDHQFTAGVDLIFKF